MKHDLEAFEAKLPEGAVIDRWITVVSYLKTDGTSQCAVLTSGAEAPLTTSLGLLRLAEHSLLTREPDWRI